MNNLHVDFGYNLLGNNNRKDYGGMKIRNVSKKINKGLVNNVILKVWFFYLLFFKKGFYAWFIMGLRWFLDIF